ncbi:MAG: PadR family transcriptional regulator [Acidobacteriota bacterium]|jgi:DNA-binding PadR family transcriptional regulator
MSDRDHEAIDAFLPLRPVEFFVLAVLHDGDLHGYGIVQEIARRTANRIEVKPGNLYRVLDRLMERGLLEEAGQGAADAIDDERRRYYTITELGTRVVRAEAEVFGAMAAGVRKPSSVVGSS